MKINIQSFGMLITGAIILLTLSVCGKKETASAAPAVSNTPALANQDIWKEKYSEPVRVTIGRGGSLIAWPAAVDFENNAYTKYLREMMNIDIKTGFFVGDSEGYFQRITISIASNDLPDIMILANNRLQLDQLIEADMVEDLTDAYRQYASPLLKAMVDSFGGIEKAMPTTFSEGRQYAMSEIQPGAQDPLFWVRDDWLIKLGLPEPKTTEDFIRLAQAFVDNDMAGNGQTVGIETQFSLGGQYNAAAKLEPFFNENHSFIKNWYDDGTGKVIYGSVAAETREALKTLRNMYKTGILAKDFSTRDWQASIAAGYPGIVIGPWWIASWPLNYTVKNNPKAVWRCYGWKSSKTGKFHTFQQNYNSMWAVVRKGYAHPEVLIKLLNASAEAQVSFDGEALTAEEKQKYGLIIPQTVLDAYRGQPNIDWGAWPTNLMLRFNDQIVKLAALQAEQVERFRKGDKAFDANAVKVAEDIVKYESGQDRGYTPWENYMRYRGMQIELQEHEDMEVQPIFYPATTPAMELRWANLQDMEHLAFIKIVMGLEPLDYFDTFVKQWYDQGGLKSTSEINEQYRGK
jgi:putative aldouronate transport system substrate-binding protein